MNSSAFGIAQKILVPSELIFGLLDYTKRQTTEIEAAVAIIEGPSNSATEMTQQAEIIENCSGVHIFDYHAPSVGYGMGTMLLILLLIAAVFVCCCRCGCITCNSGFCLNGFGQGAGSGHRGGCAHCSQQAAAHMPVINQPPIRPIQMPIQQPIQMSTPMVQMPPMVSQMVPSVSNAVSRNALPAIEFHAQDPERLFFGRVP